MVDIPHDASVTGDYASSENGGEGYLPLARTWYRKTLSVPQAWEQRTVTLVVVSSQFYTSMTAIAALD